MTPGVGTLKKTPAIKRYNATKSLELATLTDKLKALEDRGYLFVLCLNSTQHNGVLIPGMPRYYCNTNNRITQVDRQIESGH